MLEELAVTVLQSTYCAIYICACCEVLVHRLSRGTLQLNGPSQGAAS